MKFSRKKKKKFSYMHITFVCVNLLYPGQGIDFHQEVRDADDMHAIHDTLL